MSDIQRKPKSELDKLALPKAPQQPEILERETVRSEGSSGELESIGKRHQGMDGKRYAGSIAIHYYSTPKLGGDEFVFMIQSTDLNKLPEQLVAASLPELGRAIMARYGRKPPRKTTDSKVKTSERFG